MSGRRRLFDHVVMKIKEDCRNHLELKFLGEHSDIFQTILNNLEETFAISGKHLLGLGTSCITFRYGEGEVIKVCSKAIKFFHDFKTKSVVHFQKQTDGLKEYILPIKQIIYDGPQFFVYTQDRCKPLRHDDKDISALSPMEFERLITMIQTFFANGCHVGQLKPKNIGYVGGDACATQKLVLFDFHSMHNLSHRIKNHPDWWMSLVDSLTTNYYLFYASKGKCSAKVIKKDKLKRIEQKHGTKILPAPLVKFFDYVKNVPYMELDFKQIHMILDDVKLHIRTHFSGPHIHAEKHEKEKKHHHKH